MRWVRGKEMEKVMRSGVWLKKCRTAVLIAAVVCGAGAASGADDAGGVCPVFPVPREYSVKGGVASLDPAAVIVVGNQAAAPEKYAAGLLQRLVERRFKIKLAIKTESEAGTPAQTIMIGTREGNKLLDAECGKRKLDIAADKPVADAFAVDSTGGAIIIAGSNPRGSIYGADAFAALLTLKDGKPVFPAVTVRDWPAIVWRGRPGINSGTQPSNDKLEDPEYFDPVVQNRVNFIDLRDGDFGFRPGKAMSTLEHDRYAAHIEKAHNAGLFVYGVVSCGETEVEQSMEKLKELIALKVDGLWLSYDDVGINAKDPVKMISAALALGREHGITGRSIATTPPQKMMINGKEYDSYKMIDTPVNRERAKIPGFESAKWFFTRLPCEDDIKLAQEIGLKGPPAWWHNWPRPNAGFTYTARQFMNLQKDKKSRIYSYYPGLDEMNRWEYLFPCTQADLAKRQSWKYTDTAWIWGGGAQEYIDATLMLYAWNPESYNLEKARRGAYARVFGAGQVDAAMKYDDGLKRLMNEIFEVNYYRKYDWEIQREAKLPAIPFCLAKGQTREKALAELDSMQKALDSIKAKAAAETAIRADRLTSWYLDPMQVTIGIARSVLEIEFPGKVWSDVSVQVDKLLKDGKNAEAKALVADLRKQYSPEHFKAVKEKLSKLDLEYYFSWERCLETLENKVSGGAAKK